jgi:hypothetical protein
MRRVLDETFSALWHLGVLPASDKAATKPIEK